MTGAHYVTLDTRCSLKMSDLHEYILYLISSSPSRAVHSIPIHAKYPCTLNGLKKVPKNLRRWRGTSKPQRYVAIIRSSQIRSGAAVAGENYIVALCE